MAAPYNPFSDPIADMTATIVAKVRALEQEAIPVLGRIADKEFELVWTPPAPATVHTICAAMGATLMGRFQLHYEFCTALLGLEAAYGADSSTHKWAHLQADGSYLPGIPEGWHIDWVLDPDNKPTGSGIPVKE